MVISRFFAVSFAGGSRVVEAADSAAIVAKWAALSEIPMSGAVAIAPAVAIPMLLATNDWQLAPDVWFETTTTEDWGSDSERDVTHYWGVRFFVDGTVGLCCDDGSGQKQLAWEMFSSLAQYETLYDENDDAKWLLGKMAGAVGGNAKWEQTIAAIRANLAKCQS